MGNYLRLCESCGFEVHQSDPTRTMGRFFGHRESRCIELQRAEIWRMREESNKDRKVMWDARANIRAMLAHGWSRTEAIAMECRLSKRLEVGDE